MSLPSLPRFDPSELIGDDPTAVVADVAGLTVVTRSLEDSAMIAPDPSPDFADAVMAAIEAEPAPAPASRLVLAVRHLSITGAAVAIGDAWRTATSGPRPMAARVAAIGLVLAVAIGLTATGGAVVAGAGWIIGQSSGPPPTVPSVLPSPRPSPDRSPSVEPSPSPSVEPSPSVVPTEPAEPSHEAEPTETAEPTDSHEPNETPEATGTNEPDEPDGSDDHGGGSGGGSGSGSSSSGSSGSGGGGSDDAGGPGPG